MRETEGFSEHFLDLRFQSGDRTAFAYSKLTYINYNASSAQIDLRFEGYTVVLSGMHLDQGLYDALMDCRVRWIEEAVLPDDAHEHSIAYIERIEIISPSETAEFEEVPPQESSDFDAELDSTDGREPEG